MAYKRYHHRHRRGGSDDSGLGCLISIVLIFLAMPLAGIYMLIKGKDASQKVIGSILLIVGIVIWITASLG